MQLVGTPLLRCPLQQFKTGTQGWVPCGICIPQETAVAPNLSVKENLELICGIHGFSKEKTETKIKELSERFSLELVLQKKAGKLSGGCIAFF